jgi:hypothetical protein
MFMPGDEARGNDDELLSQIDELKARMDRLMKGGTSTSNSALLTDAPKQRTAHKVEPQSTPTPPPPRSKVRDLIGTEEKEILEDLPGLEDPVPFPEEAAAADESRPADRPAEDRPSSPPPPTKPKPAAVEGSIIAVDDNRNEPRPQVSSFEDLGSAIEEELARDNSVPPAAAKKGPDLASRFGPGDSTGGSEASSGSQPEQEPDDEPDEPEEAPEREEHVEQFEAIGVPAARSHVGAIVAIWVFTAVTSGTIATLHFTGII